MKKLNIKGFAASTLLYGLMLVGFLVVSLLMSIMATNRKNTSTLVKKIEEELNRYSETATLITSTDGAQEYIVPNGKSGWYKIELWGAAGKTLDLTAETSTSRGAYVSGLVYLKENSKLYFHIGTVGSVYNWTDVRTKEGAKADSTSLRTRFMVAAGGERTSSTGGTGYGTLFGISNYNDGGSYIAGYAGVNSISSSGIQAGQTNSQTTEYNIVNGMLLSGVNGGAGKAKIELVQASETETIPSKKNTNLNGIRYIKECLTLSSSDATVNDNKEIWKEIHAIDSNGVNVAKDKNATFFLAGNYQGNITGLTDGSTEPVSGAVSVTSGTYHINRCIRIVLDKPYNLEEIAIFHHIGSEMKIVKESLQVSSNDSSYFTLKSWENENNAPIEANYGLRYSDRQVENQDIIPDGKYYIASKLSNERFLTLEPTVSSEDYGISYKLFTGDIKQKWYIESVGYANDYKLTEMNGNKVLKVDYLEQIKTTKEVSNTEEDWEFINLGNGYYQIKIGIPVSPSSPTPSATPSPSATPTPEPEEYIAPQVYKCLSVNTTISNTSGSFELVECNSASAAQQFKLINAD